MWLILTRAGDKLARTFPKPLLLYRSMIEVQKMKLKKGGNIHLKGF